jgi:hypothetical protein
MKYPTIMKNKLYILGLAALMLLSAGCMFKIMHWPGAGIMITLGIFSLAFAFVPAAFVSNFSIEANKSQKMLYIVTAIVLMINFAGALFKIMHWPGAGIMISISLPLPFVVILPLYLFYKRKEGEINYKNFLAVVFFFAYFAAINALLALNVTKNLITSYVNTAISIHQNTEVLNKYSQFIVRTDSLISKEKIQIKFTSDSICNEIDRLVDLLIKNQPNSKGLLYSPNGKPNLMMLEYKDIPVGEWAKEKLTQLKSNIVAYAAVLSTNKPVEQEVKENLNLMLNCSNINDDSWENEFIKDKIIVSSIEKLYLLKHQVRLAEWQALSNF